MFSTWPFLPLLINNWSESNSTANLSQRLTFVPVPRTPELAAVLSLSLSRSLLRQSRSSITRSSNQGTGKLVGNEEVERGAGSLFPHSSNLKPEVSSQAHMSVRSNRKHMFQFCPCKREGMGAKQKLRLVVEAGLQTQALLFPSPA